MNEDKLKYIIEVVDKATREIDAVEKKIESLEKQAVKSSMSFGKLSSAFAAGGIAANFITGALSRTAGFLQQSITIASQYESTMRGLSSTSAAFGVSQDGARQAVQRLTSDGLLSQRAAAESLQKLFTAGMGLDKAEQLMQAYKDQAAFGRTSTIEYSQAVQNLAESFYTENSMIGNLSGQTENYNLIIDRGAAIMGKKASALTNAERAEAKYLGTMQLAAVVEGDSARMADTAAGAHAKFERQVYDLQKGIGSALQPAVMILTQAFTDLAVSANGEASPALQAAAKAVAAIATAFVIMGNTVIAIGKIVVNEAMIIGNAIKNILAGKGIVNGIFEAGAKAAKDNDKAINDLLNNTQKAVNNLGKTMYNIDTKGLGYYADVVKDKIGGIPDAIKDASGKAAKEAEQLARKLADSLQKISKEIDDFAHTVQTRTGDFQRSLEDLVIAHRDKIRDLRNEIAELQKEFADAQQERLDSSQEKKAAINEKYAGETETLRQNLQRRLADTKGTDEQLIAFFKAQIDEKERKRLEEIAKEDERYKKEEEKQLATYEKRKNQLTESLNKELDIQKKHQADFDSVKDKAAEDDITRLKSSFEREMSELKRQHDIRMEELKKEQEEILALKAEMERKNLASITNSAKSRSVQTSTGVNTPAFKSQSQSYVYGPPTPLDLKKAIASGGLKFSTGGMIPGEGEVPILAHGGETVMNPSQMRGVLTALEKLGKSGGGGKEGVTINQTNHIYGEMDMDTKARELGWRLSI